MTYPRTSTLLVRAARRRCPWCGSGGISRNVAAVEVECPSCGLYLERHPGSYIGGIGLNTIVSSLAVLGALIFGFVRTGDDATVTTVLLPALVVGALLPVVLYARSRLVAVALELHWWPLSNDEQAQLASPSQAGPPTANPPSSQ